MAFQLETHAHRSPIHVHESILLNSSFFKEPVTKKKNDSTILLSYCTWFLTFYTDLHLFIYFTFIFNFD